MENDGFLFQSQFFYFNPSPTLKSTSLKNTFWGPI